MPRGKAKPEGEQARIYGINTEDYQVTPRIGQVELSDVLNLIKEALIYEEYSEAIHQRRFARMSSNHENPRRLR